MYKKIQVTDIYLYKFFTFNKYMYLIVLSIEYVGISGSDIAVSLDFFQIFFFAKFSPSVCLKSYSFYSIPSNPIKSQLYFFLLPFKNRTQSASLSFTLHPRTLNRSPYCIRGITIRWEAATSFAYPPFDRLFTVPIRPILLLNLFIFPWNSINLFSNFTILRYPLNRFLNSFLPPRKRMLVDVI